MSSKTIFIIEDDKHIAKLVRYNLEKAGFRCEVFITGEEALGRLDKVPVDLIILDIMLPKMDGMEICKLLKQDKKTSYIPVVMLTAKGEEVDRIIGFELGADDYIVKPFSPRELVLRVKAVLRRGVAKETSKDVFEVGQILLDVSRHKVNVDGKDVTLTSMEFKLLLTLMQRKGRVQSRENLLEDVWELDSEVTTRTVDTHIKRLRQKLKTQGPTIETIRGLGYRLKDAEDEACD